MSRKQKNYLRTYRKRAGLSQQETAFLFGCRSGAKISRYELERRQITAEAVLTYEVIFQVPVRELFGGLYWDIKQKTVKRAKLLAKRVRRSELDASALRKLTLLEAIASSRHVDPIFDNA